jgi:outer membrane protein assembly factor BamB
MVASETSDTILVHPMPRAPVTSVGWRSRLWPAVALVVAFWIAFTLPRMIEMPIALSFFSGVIASALFTLTFLAWWLLTRSVGRPERVAGLLALFVGAATAVALSQQTLGTVGLLYFGLPVAFTIWTIWLLVSRRLSTVSRVVGLVVVLGLSWGYFTLIRMDGLSGDLQANIHWRWAPKAEDVYLAERAAAPVPTEALSENTAPLALRPGDWPALGGANRDGVVHDTHVATDWQDNPPRLVWRQRVGPAWSSVAIVDGRLFTQEQRGEEEAVVCLDPATGREIWSHVDRARFWDGQAGAGPRATPAFADGRIYALGATGILNCLDAATGSLRWTRNIVGDSGAATPMWGFSGSPLVINGLVVAYAGGPDPKGLIAYRAEDGEPAWTAATGPVSYSSPQPVAIGGETQVLFLSDRGLVAVESGSGAVRWQHESVNSSMWRVVQPRLIDQSGVLVGSEDLGLVRLDIAAGDSSWSAAERFASKAMKPAYNDFVVADGFVYGFDGGIFCCVDAATGKRRWKAGRYGHGQLLLLAEQSVLLVQAEGGDVLLVAASPQEHKELARLHALDAKTWNHPVVAHGRLYVRNDEEMACYELPADAQN